MSRCAWSGSESAPSSFTYQALLARTSRTAMSGWACAGMAVNRKRSSATIISILAPFWVNVWGQARIWRIQRTMKLATWNVNSIKVRLEPALAWLKEAVPDAVVLQEIKCVDDAFPRQAFEEIGYNCAVHGQKTYNGVAILTRRPLDDVTPRLKGADHDDHARYIEAVVPGDKGTVRIASIYAPNGNPIGTEKF